MVILVVPRHVVIWTSFASVDHLEEVGEARLQAEAVGDDERGVVQLWRSCSDAS